MIKRKREKKKEKEGKEEGKEEAAKLSINWPIKKQLTYSPIISIFISMNQNEFNFFLCIFRSPIPHKQALRL